MTSAFKPQTAATRVFSTSPLYWELFSSRSVVSGSSSFVSVKHLHKYRFNSTVLCRYKYKYRHSSLTCWTCHFRNVETQNESLSTLRLWPLTSDPDVGEERHVFIYCPFHTFNSLLGVRSILSRQFNSTTLFFKSDSETFQKKKRSSWCLVTGQPVWTTTQQKFVRRQTTVNSE